MIVRILLEIKCWSFTFTEFLFLLQIAAFLLNLLEGENTVHAN